MKTIIVYVENASYTNGILTWIDNFYQLMRNDFEIRVMASMMKIEFANKYEHFDSGAEYECDILLHNYECNSIPLNIRAKQTYIILHCDYGAIPDKYRFDKNRKYIAVSEVAAEGMRREFGVDCRSMEGFMEQKPKRQKVYRFLSATRPAPTKGIDRMVRLARMLKDAGYTFQWLVFYDGDIVTSHYRSEIPELILCKTVPHDTLLRYMADADYVVQLSTAEGFCMAVHEALMMGTPVLATDIPVFEIIRNGYNGYRLPLDMEHIDIEKIMHEIPRKFKYDTDLPETRRKWIDLFIGGKNNAEDNQAEHNADKG